jgi:uncharacterized membrane protein
LKNKKPGPRVWLFYFYDLRHDNEHPLSANISVRGIFMKLVLTALLLISANVYAYEENMDRALTFRQDILPIFQAHCTSCHHSAAYIPDWTTYETSYMMRDRIMVRVYDARNMPPGNMTNMTDEERTIVAQWISSGAPQ